MGRFKTMPNKSAERNYAMKILLLKNAVDSKLVDEELIECAEEDAARAIEEEEKAEE